MTKERKIVMWLADIWPVNRLLVRWLRWQLRRAKARLARVTAENARLHEELRER
jgi:hypothetical protein